MGRVRLPEKRMEGMEGWLAALSLFLLSSHQNPHNTMLAGVEGPPTG